MKSAWFSLHCIETIDESVVLILKIFLLLSIYFIVSPQTANATLLDLSKYQKEEALGEYFEVLEDVDGTYTLKEVLLENKNWRKSTEIVPNYGFSKHTFWFRTQIKRQEEAHIPLILSVEYAGLKNVKFYEFEKNTLLHEYSVGDSPYHNRPIQVQGFAFPFQTSTEEKTLLLRIHSPYQTVQVPIFIRDLETFHIVRVLSAKIEGLFVGIIFAMLLYNIFLYIEIRRSDYIYYAAFMLVSIAFQISLSGFGFAHVWPNFPRWQSISASVTVPLLVVLADRFFIGFLNLQRKGPYKFYYDALWINISIGTVLTILPFFYPHPLVTLCSVILAIEDCCFVMLFSLKVWNDGYRPAKYFTIAWTVFLIGTVVRALNKVGFAPFNMFTENIQQFGSIVEVLLLSFSLGDKINFELNQDQAKIKSLNDQLQQSIGLVEIRVEEQTRHIASVMSHIEQGIFTIDAHLLIEEHHSTHLEKILERSDIYRKNPFEVFLNQCDLSKDDLSRIESAIISFMGEDSINFSVNSAHLPREAIYKHKILELNWQNIVNSLDVTEKLLVVIRDVSEFRALEKLRSLHQEELSIIAELIAAPRLQSKGFFKQSLQDVSEMLSLLESESAGSNHVLKKIFMRLHTMKGVARSLQFKSLIDMIHEAESDCSEVLKGEQVYHLNELKEAVEKVSRALHNYVEASEDKLGRTTSHLEKIDELIADKSLRAIQGLPHSFRQQFHDLERLLRRTCYVSSHDLLEELHSQAKSLAHELNRAEPHLKIQGQAVEIPRPTGQALVNILTHLLRNSMDHGIENAENRIKQGKPGEGTLTIRIERNAEGLSLDYRDDGSGLRLDKIKDIGIRRGLINMEEYDPIKIAQLIFEVGFSTATSISQISGRGIGMGAVRDELEQLGGSFQLILLDPSPTLNSPCPLAFVISIPLEVLDIAA